MILSNEKRVLIPIFSEKDMFYILENIDKIEIENTEFILLRLLDEQHIKIVSQRLKKDHEEYLAKLTDDAWHNLYYFQEELTKKGIKSKVALRKGNSLNELIDFSNTANINVIMFTRELGTGIEGTFKEKLLKKILINWGKIIIII